MSKVAKLNKLRWSWLILGWLWVGVVFYVSLMPHPPQPVTFWQADKFEHALSYCLLMLWFCQIYRTRTTRTLLAFMLIVMGIVIEYLQRETGYRTFEYADMVADVSGVLVGGVWARTGLGRIFAYIEYHSGKKRHLD